MLNSVEQGERSGSVVECLTRDLGSEPHCVVSLSKNINPSLVLVQPRKTRPFTVFFLCFRGMVAGPFKRGKLARVGAKRGKLLT